ncbi:MAG: helix-turn-helix transcriptional regulator [Acidobacteria bacterium]|nr:helix-turn-helix transcriptional regulator [Acidobacteriota bacterium]
MKQELPKEFGKAIRELRHERRLTQERLAEAVEVTAEYISHIERGLTKSPPSWRVLNKLANALGVIVVAHDHSWTLKLAA